MNHVPYVVSMTCVSCPLWHLYISTTPSFPVVELKQFTDWTNESTVMQTMIRFIPKTLLRTLAVHSVICALICTVPKKWHYARAHQITGFSSKRVSLPQCECDSWRTRIAPMEGKWVWFQHRGLLGYNPQFSRFVALLVPFQEKWHT